MNIEIDMENIIDVNKYIELVKQSTDKIGNLYKIFLKIKDIKYTCYVFVSKLKAITYFLKIDTTPTDFNSINIGALNGNMVFMLLDSDGTGELKTRDIDFETIKINGKENKLDTIFYLRTFFYRMLGVETIHISDEAMFLCKDKPQEYTALMYRIFATDKSLNELCIYQRYFKTIKRELNDSKLNELLIKFRQSQCPFDHSKTIRDYFREFDKNCPTMAIKLNELHDILNKDNKDILNKDFKDFYSSLSIFSAKTIDSIYWPTEPAFKHKRKIKKSKKSKTRNKKSLKHRISARQIKQVNIL